MQNLRLIAGKKAWSLIAQNGLTADVVRLVLGASGGPKWLVLAGLDRFVFGHWLKSAKGPIDLIGSSIGAWRMAMAAHPAPDTLFGSFLEAYVDFPFEKGDGARQITKTSYEILERMLPPEARRAILENGMRALHIVAVRGKGLAGRKNLSAQAAGFLLAAGANALDRSGLGSFFDRAVFHSQGPALLDGQWEGFHRLDIRLTAENFAAALMASGAIPGLMEPVRDIIGAPPGLYLDGGVIDYHFAEKWQLASAGQQENSLEKIVLYPHFYPYLIPGWFDKRRKSRRAGPDILENMLILCPSEAFKAQLPKKHIPDRKDFTRYSRAARLDFWRETIRLSEKLAQEFEDCLENHDKLMDKLEKIA